MNQLYNPQEFAALVLRAVGNTKKKEFARLIEVTPEHFSRILNNKLANPPSIATIQAIASHASNGVTYAQLLQAAGYPVDASGSSSIDAPNALSDHARKLMQGTILTALPSLGIPCTMDQVNKDTGFHLSVSFSNGVVSHWHFYFLYNGSPELMSSKLSSLYSSLIFKSVSETEKISFVTTSEEEFALYLGKIPANLNLNLSVILIEENTLSVKKETWLHSTPSISDTDISHYTLSSIRI